MKNILLKLKQKRNSGSSLTTVIIVCAFMSILGTIFLYISGANFKMKVADYSTKKSFYQAEEVVELFESQLIEDVSVAAEGAYKQTGCRYVELGASANREGLYYSNFGDKFEDVWSSHWSDSTGALSGEDLYIKGIKEMFPATSYTTSTGSVIVSNGAQNVTYSNGRVTFDITLNGQTMKCIINDLATTSDNSELKSHGKFSYGNALNEGTVVDGVVSYYEIYKLDITVTNENNYTSKIITNFKITPPAINWSDSTELLDTNLNKITQVDFTQTVTYSDWSKE